MLSKGPQTPRILELAARIEQDISIKKLRPGDSYLKTSEIARMLGVSTGAANRAMQLLNKRRVLHRRQRSGAIVAEGIMKTDPPSLRCVHFLVHQNYLKTEGLLGDGTLIGMQAELRDVNVQLNFLPLGEEIDDVNRLIAAALRSHEPEGFVLVRSSLKLQRLVQASGLPCVVHGMLYPSIHGVAWISRDERQCGRLLTEYVLSRGHRRVLNLARDRIFAGEHPFEVGISETLVKAGIGLSGLTTLHLPADHDAIRAAAGEVLRASEAPLGIIARSEPLAEGAASAAADAGLTVGRDVTIAVANIYRAGNDNPVAFPHIRNVVESEQIGMHIGRMLSQQACGLPLDPDHEIIPIRMENLER
jgi:DNA-binding LacI/PurR family transcriptional regulator